MIGAIRDLTRPRRRRARRGAFIPVSIGALAGVPERDAGVASGLIDTSQQLGAAIGIAVASTVAASRSSLLLGHGSAPADALTGAASTRRCGSAD